MPGLQCGSHLNNFLFYFQLVIALDLICSCPHVVIFLFVLMLVFFQGTSDETSDDQLLVEARLTWEQQKGHQVLKRLRLLIIGLKVKPGH